ncbi:ribosome production factor 2 homolog [Rhopilema esculentum]|uniref:ribosome production factor 2 homolog n=1 Tax=Rhopilema esculentum TaxID=499914 RepID=UPI0031DE361A|eukprot:gene17586-9224_t
MAQIVKPKTQRGKRAIEKKEPKILEDIKSAIIIRGGRTSEIVTDVLKNIYILKKPNAVMFQRKNILRPFEDQNSLEFFSQKNDASLFVFGSHSKKRPNNLVFGRFYDGHILDMAEFGVENYIPISGFKTEKCTSGTKPCLLFSGEIFDSDPEYKRIKSIFIDFWRGPLVESIRLQGLEHVLQFTAIDGKVLMRSYRVALKKSGLKTPRIELVEMGPSIDFLVRRTRLASNDLYKEACRQPKAAKIQKTKNVDHDVFGTKTGRIHMQSQDLDKLQTRKVKALKRTTQSSKDATKKAKRQKQAET